MAICRFSIFSLDIFLHASGEWSKLIVEPVHVLHAVEMEPSFLSGAFPQFRWQFLPRPFNPGHVLGKKGGSVDLHGDALVLSQNILPQMFLHPAHKKWIDQVLVDFHNQFFIRSHLDIPNSSSSSRMAWFLDSILSWRIPIRPPALVLSFPSSPIRRSLSVRFLEQFQHLTAFQCASPGIAVPLWSFEDVTVFNPYPERVGLIDHITQFLPGAVFLKVFRWVVPHPVTAQPDLLFKMVPGQVPDIFTTGKEAIRGILNPEPRFIKDFTGIHDDHNSSFSHLPSTGTIMSNLVKA